MGDTIIFVNLSQLPFELNLGQAIIMSKEIITLHPLLIARVCVLWDSHAQQTNETRLLFLSLKNPQLVAPRLA